MKMDLRNNYMSVVIIILLSSCSNFESKLSQYMEKDMPSCTDTTYWRLVDLQDVIGVKYDKLYLIGSEFEEDIAKGTGTDWKDGDFISWDKDLLLLVKGNEIVYKDVIEKADKRFYAFDKFCLSEDSIVDPLCEYHKTGWPLIEKSTLYYIRTDVIKGKRYYTLYNKERMEHGKTYFQPWKWLKDPKRTPWGQRLSPHNGLNQKSQGRVGCEPRKLDKKLLGFTSSPSPVHTVHKTNGGTKKGQGRKGFYLQHF